jgi:polysaccharide chain length determinant protein (PEP-CTERM system associated)
MDDTVRQIIIDLRSMWRYRWLGLLAAWIVAALGVAVVMTLPDRYEASARIFVNTESILKPLMAGMTVEPNIDQRIAILSRVVISRPNVEKLISLVGLEAQARSRDDYEQLADKLAKALQIRGTGRDNVYTLSYRDSHPERARRMVEQFTSLFVESGKGTKTNDTDVAKKFIDEQVAIYEKRLQEAEARLKEFRLRYLGMNAGAGRDYFSNLQEATALLSQAQLQLREAENSRNALRQELAREVSSEETRSAPDPAAIAGAPSGGESIAEIDSRVDSMRRTLDTLLQKYTDNHPDVIGARRVIKELEDQRRQLVAARKKDGTPVISPASARGQNAYDQLRVSLAQAEANVASLQTRVAEYNNRYERLKESAKLVPQLDAEFAQLNRDYDVNKKNYESLVARRESASLSGEMQAVSGVGDFRLIDPPRVSPRPVAPNRLLLLPLTLLAALATGLGVMFSAIKIRPTFYDGKTLRAVGGLPVLGTISTLASEAGKRERTHRVIRFAAGVAALLGAYGAAFAALMFITARAV